MENRRKFYTGGLWAFDTMEQRYDHIKWALDNQNNLDEDELKFIIKNGFVSKIYISDGVVKKYKPSDFVQTLVLRRICLMKSLKEKTTY